LCCQHALSKITDNHTKQNSIELRSQLGYVGNWHTAVISPYQRCVRAKLLQPPVHKYNQMFTQQMHLNSCTMVLCQRPYGTSIKTDWHQKLSNEIERAKTNIRKTGNAGLNHDLFNFNFSLVHKIAGYRSLA